ncbi:hypothetical protein Pelo_2854 [Pelomyxa schiedti]|nr:hypothetical protein Pelo_2854 [Pelomyxa schiedti]
MKGRKAKDAAAHEEKETASTSSTTSTTARSCTTSTSTSTSSTATAPEKRHLPAKRGHPPMLQTKLKSARKDGDGSDDEKDPDSDSDEKDEDEVADDHKEKLLLDTPKKGTMPYYGEVQCSRAPKCKNKAYWFLHNEALCGVHARAPKGPIKDKEGQRVPLPKRPRREQQEIAQREKAAHSATVEVARLENLKAGRVGRVALYRMRMMTSPPNEKGWMKVFPNFKHGNRTDGFGCMHLSPKFLGPVEHGQPGLPPALNIENFHQCFPEELAEDRVNPGPLFYKNRLQFYTDPTPHRHKYKNNNNTNPNIPVYFVWVDKDGTEHHLNYIQSRQFYCNFYARMASQQAEYHQLVEMYKNGTNLCICGYDAFPLVSQTVQQAYLDASKPFGHERVLYAMLTTKEDDWVWKKYKTFDFYVLY